MALQETIDKLITIVFNNGLQLEGNLVSFSNNELKVKSLDETSVIHIPNVSHNVFYYKINFAKDEYTTLKNKNNKTDEDLKELSLLKSQLNDIERSSISKQLSSSLNDTRNYVPTKLPQQSPIKHSTEETTRTNFEFATELQSLFGKKH